MLEAMRRIINEGRKMGAGDFYIGGDIIIELKLETCGEDLQGLDGIDWHGINGQNAGEVARSDHFG